MTIILENINTGDTYTADFIEDVVGFCARCAFNLCLAANGGEVTVGDWTATALDILTAEDAAADMAYEYHLYCEGAGLY